MYSIQDYLVKIKDHEWVLGECIAKVASSSKAQRKLLEYGLALTSCARVFDGLEVPPKGTHLSQVRHLLLLLLLFGCAATSSSHPFLTAQQAQRDLCTQRMVLVRYLDRLTTYEVRGLCFFLQLH